MFIDSDSPGAADRLPQAVLSTAEGLADFPMLGHAGKRAGTRELVLSKYPYTIIYRLTLKKIGLVAVVHQSRQHPS